MSIFLLPLLGAINSQNFPEVLSPEDEAFYLEKWKNHDIEARNVLENTGIEKDDLLSIGAFGLIKAVNTFNFDATNKLATYASRCIENEILMYIRNNKKRKDTISLYAPIGEDKDGNEIKLCDVIEDPSPSISERIVEDEQNKLIQEAVNKLTGREYEIICRRFGLNGFQAETQREIAKSMGISRSYVSRIEKRVLTKLYLNLKEHN